MNHPWGIYHTIASVREKSLNHFMTWENFPKLLLMEEAKIVSLEVSSGEQTSSHRHKSNACAPLCDKFQICTQEL